jgi:hypothetical protein
MKDRSASKGAPANASVLDWLLEEDQPSVRSLALTELLERKATDPEVRGARGQISRVGWAADMLERQGPKGFWERRAPTTTPKWIEFLWLPMYHATLWRALVLSELGADSSDPRIRKLAEIIFDYKLRLSSPFNFFHEEVCMSGNTARMLTRFGFGEDRRVQKLFDWLLEDQREDGGWNCSQGTPGILDAWEALAAFASVPKAKRGPRMEAAIAKGAEFYLERGIVHEGRRYAPWYRIHYPNHYFYDFLVGLDVLTALGYGSDRRLRTTLDLLRKKQRPDGTWWIDRYHPDTGPEARQAAATPKERPLVIEPRGRPSKWITLRALRVLKRAADDA